MSMKGGYKAYISYLSFSINKIEIAPKTKGRKVQSSLSYNNKIIAISLSIPMIENKYKNEISLVPIPCGNNEINDIIELIA